MNIVYYWSKFLKKLPLSAVKNSHFERPCKVNARSSLISTKMGKYSYCGYGCTIIDCEIGRFCSIADDVKIGLANHPKNWVSTSPAFYKGKNSIPKDLAVLDYNSSSETTTIGNDVWIGTRAIIKRGVVVGDGAIIAMGAVVTKNVSPYAIVAGVPAQVIGYRFNEETIIRLEKTKWWNLPNDELKKYAQYFNDVDKLLDIIEGQK